MIARRTMLAYLAALAAPIASALPLPGPATPARRARIFTLLAKAEGPADQAFRAQLALDGIDTEIVPREVGSDIVKITAAVREARARGADLIYASGAALAEALAGPAGANDPARSVTDIPIVFTALTLTPEQGVALATGRRNVTGVAAAVPPALQLDAIRAYRPFERVGVIVNPANKTTLATVEQLRTAAALHNVALIERHLPLDPRGQPLASALPELVAALARQEAQLLYVPQDDWLATNGKPLTDAALAQHLPSFTADATLLRHARALFGLVPSPESAGRIAGHQAARILKEGAAPGTLPVQGLPRNRCIINMSVATALELYPPVALLNTAEILR
ncbi:ABC transporter substrate binding protein [Zemynaea arenosa]|nr:ABC transporter substrate binding protein [Massilia arenosa]